jgi:hypothetical protein
MSAARKLNDIMDLFNDAYDPNLCELDIVDWQFIDSVLERYSADIHEKKLSYVREILEPQKIKFKVKPNPAPSS